MGSAIGLGDDFDGPALRVLARASSSANQTRRLLALAEIYDGGSRGYFAQDGPGRPHARRIPGLQILRVKRLVGAEALEQIECHVRRSSG